MHLFLGSSFHSFLLLVSRVARLSVSSGCMVAGNQRQRTKDNQGQPKSQPKDTGHDRLERQLALLYQRNRELRDELLTCDAGSGSMSPMFVRCSAIAQIEGQSALTVRQSAPNQEAEHQLAFGDSCVR